MKPKIVNGCKIPRMFVQKAKAKFSLVKVPEESLYSDVPSEKLVHHVIYQGLTYQMVDFDNNVWMDMLTGDFMAIET